MKNLNPNKILLLGGMLLLGLLLGWLIFGQSDKEEKQSSQMEAEAEQIWTCSMHPQIKKKEPGDCPICGMELIPLESSESNTPDPSAISMSPTAMQLAQVQTSKVESSGMERQLRLTGKIQADERQTFTQSAHVSGRIEKLLVNFTGEYVNEGDLLALIYSPELVSAQEELFESRQFKAEEPKLYQAALNKLKNWKLSENQIDKIIAAEEPIEDFPLLATTSGYVTQKKVKTGDYVKLGAPIYEVANLSQVWVMFDVYEQDLNWIEQRTKVEFTVDALKGRTFQSKITYIDPTIDPKTRVAKARAVINNPKLKLRPEMFVSGVIESRTKSKNGQLTVPKSAVMWTGKRSLVYVMEKTENTINFSMREVTLGEDLGSHYSIKAGLKAGEEIATNGTFSIDAAAQLAGKASMMNPEGGTTMSGHQHGKKMGSDREQKSAHEIGINEQAKAALLPLYSSYFKMKQSLSKDDFDSAIKAVNQMKKKLSQVEMKDFQGEGHQLWMQQSKKLNHSLSRLNEINDIEVLRTNFIEISDAIINLTHSFQPIEDTLFVQRCPMANSNQGANWLSQEEEILNPYFGESMLKCGETIQKITNP